LVGRGARVLAAASNHAKPKGSRQTNDHQQAESPFHDYLASVSRSTQ
jgi:hypothetical protein